jgi:ABC-type branched-subunit amino acid transport system substrate-binding protein
MEGYRGALAASGWALAGTFLENGGAAAEGLLTGTYFNPFGDDPVLVDFRRRFEDRAGHPPDLTAILSYEAARVLLEALEGSGSTDPDRAKAWLLGRSFSGGPSGPFRIDRFGDAVRAYRLFVVRGGRFVEAER